MAGVAVVAAMRAAGYRLALALMQAWWVVRRPRSRGVRCVLRRGDAIVLVRHAYGDRRWMLPGGRVRRGEDPIATARREMRAELGIAGEGWRVLGCLGARRSYRRASRADAFRRHSTVYLEAAVPAPALAPRAGELTAAAWFTPGGLPPERSENVDVAAAAGWLSGSGAGAG
jgi:ADP-ribose pyrophosphatase YjhB (NUDIX family)